MQQNQNLTEKQPSAENLTRIYRSEDPIITWDGETQLLTLSDAVPEQLKDCIQGLEDAAERTDTEGLLYIAQKVREWRHSDKPQHTQLEQYALEPGLDLYHRFLDWGKFGSTQCQICTVAPWHHEYQHSARLIAEALIMAASEPDPDRQLIQYAQIGQAAIYAFSEHLPAFWTSGEYQPARHRFVAGLSRITAYRLSLLDSDLTTLPQALREDLARVITTRISVPPIADQFNRNFIEDLPVHKSLREIVETLEQIPELQSIIPKCKDTLRLQITSSPTFVHLLEKDELLQIIRTASIYSQRYRPHNISDDLLKNTRHLLAMLGDSIRIIDDSVLTQLQTKSILKVHLALRRLDFNNPLAFAGELIPILQERTSL